jgi:hypothetical protein
MRTKTDTKRHDLGLEAHVTLLHLQGVAAALSSSRRYRWKILQER